MQDTLRLLRNLALMDGVFGETVTTRKTLYSIKLPIECSETDRRLPISLSMRKVPVLRRTRHHRITDDLVQTADIHPQFRRLERFFSFESRLVTYCLHCGGAYVLAKETTGLTRRFLMGHSSDKEFNPYQSVVLPTDFPAMFRGIQQRSLACLTSILLSRSHSTHSRPSLACPLTEATLLHRACLWPAPRGPNEPGTEELLSAS
jgi:hypothetical protein